MKTRLQIKDFIPFTMMMALIAVGLYFALMVYRTHEPIAKGVSGLTLLALVYRTYYRSPERSVNEPTRFLFEYPTGFRYLGFGVFWAIVNFWALEQIFDMVLYLMKLS